VCVAEFKDVSGWTMRHDSCTRVLVRSTVLDVVSKSRLKSTLCIGVGTGGHREHVPPAHGEGGSHNYRPVCPAVTHIAASIY